MKVAIASKGKEKTSLVDQRFGRCAYFQVVDLSQPEKIKVVENPGKGAQRGAGVVAAQLVVNQGVEQVIAGNFGPNAERLLSSAGIKMVPRSAQLTVNQTVKEFLDEQK